MASTRAVPDLTGYLNHAGHVLETQLHAALAEIGLTTRMQCVLGHALEAERTQIQLAELSYLDKTTMVVTVDALEKAGYAERKPSATDRRARIVSVTEAGAKLAREGQAIVDRVHRETLAALTADQQGPFVAALETLVDGHLATPVEAQPVRRGRQRAG
ncbi:MarR family transcriptional regulator [Kribbella sandramycini]|uniref:MarR family transcriptional regulator n=1 Tax=Kribbella sandramycini TaxID=60450 RepID=A0A7Y4L477_9ACTN|nr:MarR family transcriptional regulator [Kribbella sandramycini]MBB6570901.1 DNA-binding MarR family transcriptional regulator [Kribbella sandramycini]NOL44032.1 MarR family transcriptional regulator [Kribbella sandramycini]